MFVLVTCLWMLLLVLFCLVVWFKCCVPICELWCWKLDLFRGVLLVLLFVVGWICVLDCSLFGLVTGSCLNLGVLLWVFCCCGVVMTFCLGVVVVVLFCWLLVWLVIVIGNVFI